MFYKKITADGDLQMPAGVRIYGVRLESVSDDCYAIIYDDITQSAGATAGNEICKLLVSKAGAGVQAHPGSDQQMFGSIGITLERGLSVTLDGTGARIFVYYA